MYFEKDVVGPYLAMGGLVLIGSLMYHQVSGGILIGIITLAIASWIIEGLNDVLVTVFRHLIIQIWFVSQKRFLLHLLSNPIKKSPI